MCFTWKWFCFLHHCVLNSKSKTRGLWPDMLFTLHIFLQEPVRGARLMPSVDAWLLHVHVCKHVGLCSAGSQCRCKVGKGGRKVSIRMCTNSPVFGRKTSAKYIEPGQQWVQCCSTLWCGIQLVTASGRKVPPGLAFAGVIVPAKPAAQKTVKKKKTPPFVKAASSHPFFSFFFPFWAVDWF